MRQQARTDGLKFGEGTIEERNGKFVARWRMKTATGVKRPSKTFATRDLAEDHLRTVFRAMRDQTYDPGCQVTIRQVIDGYLIRGAAEWKPHTLATYRTIAKNHLYREFGEIMADQLKTAHIQHWIDYTLIKARYRPNTINRFVTVLRAACTQAVAISQMPRNPVIGVKIPRAERVEPETWDREETHAVMAVLTDSMYRLLYAIMLTTGMRPGEARALRWSDIDFDGGRVHIRTTITRDEQMRSMAGTSTKTNRSRQVPLDEEELAALRSWKAEQNKLRLKCPTPWNPGNFIFSKTDGRYLADTTWIDYHVRLCKRAGVRYIPLHGLRHTHATDELAAGTNAKIVMERLGHSSVKTTLDSYSHVSPTVHREAAKALRQRLIGTVKDASKQVSS